MTLIRSFVRPTLLASSVIAWAGALPSVASGQTQTVSPAVAPEVTAAQPATPAGATGPAAIAETEAAPVPSQGFLITGYGSTAWAMAVVDDDRPNDFSASVSPLLLFQISDRFLFESELEFELEDGATTTNVEYAQIDFSPMNNLKVVAGKFLLPFNAFSERLHPSWINKFTSPPPLYGHGAGSGPAPPLLPILSDVGVQLRSAFDIGRFGYFSADAFVSQGPNVEVGHDEADEMGAEPEGVELPEVVFGQNYNDNNAGKMFGGRVGGGVAPYFEANASVLTGHYDGVGALRFSAFGAHLEGRVRGVEVHGEWISTSQQFTGHPEESGEILTLVRHGYFVQTSYRIGKWEPVGRWTQILAADAGAQRVVDSGEQFAVGLVYWLQPMLAVKTEFSMNLEAANVRNNRVAVQWAFGF
jgi:hypothetical protein